MAGTLVKDTFNHWLEDGALRLSAALAYYSIFSIAPLLILAIGLAGLFFGEEAVRGQLNGQLSQFIGAQAAQGVQSLIQSASKPSSGVMATIIGLVTLLLGASGIFGQLKDALNTIWEVKAKPGQGVWGFIRQRLLSFGMVLVIGFLLLVSLLLTTLLAAFSQWTQGALSLPSWFWSSVGFLVSFGVVTLLFALMFKILPDAKIEWHQVWIGAVATAFLFEVGKFGLGYYLGRESTASAYGPAASVILLLLWVYYASAILLFGAEFTQVYAQATGASLVPKEGAEAVTPEARAEQGLEPSKTPPASSGALAGAQDAPSGTPAQPPKESLATGRAVARHLPTEPIRDPRLPAGLDDFLRQHPVAGLLGAIGSGWALQRAAGRALREARPPEPLALAEAGTRTLGLAGLLLIGRSMRYVWRALRRVPVPRRAPLTKATRNLRSLIHS